MTTDEERTVLELFRQRTQLQREVRANLEAIDRITERLKAMTAQTYIRDQLAKAGARRSDYARGMDGHALTPEAPESPEKHLRTNAITNRHHLSFIGAALRC